MASSLGSDDPDSVNTELTATDSTVQWDHDESRLSTFMLGLEDLIMNHGGHRSLVQRGLFVNNKNVFYGDSVPHIMAVTDPAFTVGTWEKPFDNALFAQYIAQGYDPSAPGGVASSAPSTAPATAPASAPATAPSTAPVTPAPPGLSLVVPPGHRGDTSKLASHMRDSFIVHPLLLSMRLRDLGTFILNRLTVKLKRDQIAVSCDHNGLLILAHLRALLTRLDTATHGLMVAQRTASLRTGLTSETLAAWHQFRESYDIPNKALPVGLRHDAVQTAEDYKQVILTLSTPLFEAVRVEAVLQHKTNLADPEVIDACLTRIFSNRSAHEARALLTGGGRLGVRRPHGSIAPRIKHGERRLDQVRR